MRLPRRILAAAFAAATFPAAAVEFRSVANDAALLYEAPALNAARAAILTRAYPVEVVSQTKDWVRVRDASGQLLWVEAKALGTRRTVLVAVQFADVHQAPDANSPLTFRAEREVVLDLLDASNNLWAKVRHPDGLIGYVRTEQLWGL